MTGLRWIAPVRETALIEAIAGVLGRRGARVARWLGDDASVVRAAPLAVTSVDMMVDGVHFRRETAALEDIGCRALAGALSDLAAMGAEAGECYLAVGSPRTSTRRGLVALHRGAEALAERSGAVIAGGDLSRAPALVLAVTVVGWAREEAELVRPRRRAAGRPGRRDRRARRVGRGPGDPRRPGRGARQDLVRRHLRPEPRLAEGAGARGRGRARDDRPVRRARHRRRGTWPAPPGRRSSLRLDALPLAPGVPAVDRSSSACPRESWPPRAARTTSCASARRPSGRPRSRRRRPSLGRRGPRGRAGPALGRCRERATRGSTTSPDPRPSEASLGRSARPGTLGARCVAFQRSQMAAATALGSTR